MVALGERPVILPGQAKLEVTMVSGESAVTSAVASNPMKLLIPVARGVSAWAYTSSFGGGLVAGDRTELTLKVTGGARCFLGTQSSTKVYRNPTALPCYHTTHASLEDGSVLVFVPEPIQAFAEAEYAQRQEFHLGPHAGLVLLDWFSSGRVARGERWAFRELETRNDIFVQGRRVLVDAIRLQSKELAAQMGRFNCLATLLLTGAPVQTYAESLLQNIAARPVEKRAPFTVSASPIYGGALIRAAGEDVETVRRELVGLLNFLGALLGDDPWARRW